MRANGEKILNGKRIMKEMVLKVDTSPEHMKKVRKMFRGLEDIKISMSGCQLLEMTRTSKRIL